MDKAKQNQLADSICKAIEAPLAKGIASVFQFCENSTEELRKAHEAAMQDLISKHADEVAELKRQLDEAAKGGAVPSAAPKAATPKRRGNDYGKDAIRHKMFPKIKRLVELGKIPFLCGPAGSGKNVICEMLAQDLKLDFYFTNKVTQEYGLQGFVDAHGDYVSTQFYDAFTKGGLFFFDEMDGSSPEVLTLMNAAIANRYFDFPGKGIVYAHKDFRVIGAGNTCGLGADEQYTGRYQLDAATLDRFGYIFVDYDERVELSIAKGNKELVEFVHDLRRAMDIANTHPFTVSYRAIRDIVDVENDDVFTIEDAISMYIVKGMDADNIRNLHRNLDNVSNKYARAFNRCAINLKSSKIAA